MKTVAIIGSHSETRELFDFERTDADVWVFNEAMNQKWVKRADAVFQMHLPTVWRSSVNRNDPKHYEWLQSNTEQIVYMIDKFDDVPMSERYPLEGVLKLAPRFGYFTSSVAYAIALAVHQEYDRIELYGVEMETNTEYSHQRTGVAFWVGVAVGRGVDVEHYTNKFWDAPLYGYEGNVRIEIEQYQNRIEALKPLQEQAAQRHKEVKENIGNLLNEFAKSYKTDLSRLDDLILAAGQTAHDFGMLDGALQVNEKYLEKCIAMRDDASDYLIVRQEYEGQMHGGLKSKQDAHNQVFATAQVLKEKRLALNTNAEKNKRELLVIGFKAAYDKYVKQTTLTGVNGGVMMENRELLMLYDKLLNSNGTAEEVEVAVENLPVGV